MTPALEALARRAVACKGWMWMPGARGVCGDWSGRVASAGDGSVWWYTAGDPAGHLPVGREPLPDFDDDATRGCLLAIVREAWGDPEISAVAMQGYDGDFGWRMYVPAAVQSGPDQDGFGGDTEAEALVAALEAAP